jgi:hypothetical protein
VTARAIDNQWEHAKWERAQVLAAIARVQAQVGEVDVAVVTARALGNGRERRGASSHREGAGAG